jgi:pimeloyl-ACP methyl ester carboxylesterase
MHRDLLVLRIPARIQKSIIPMKAIALVLAVICGSVMAGAVATESLHGQAEQVQNSAAGVGSPDSKFVNLNGIRIHYLEWGRSGPHIVLLHGMNGDAWVWKNLAPILGSDYHVVAPDRRGAGESDKPAEGYDFHTLVDDVALFSENLKLKPVIVIGHSFGAQVALMTSAMKPELVSSVVLIDGGFWPKRSGPDNEAPSSDIEKASREYDPDTIYPKISVPVLMVLAKGSGPDANVIAQLKEKGIDYFEEVRKSEQGAKDLANRKLSQVETTVVENTGHYVQVDQPQKLADAIKRFLSKRVSP